MVAAVHQVKDPEFEAKHHRGTHGRFGPGMTKPKLLKRDERAVTQIGRQFSSHPIPTAGHAAAYTRGIKTRIRPETVNAFHELAGKLRRKDASDNRVKALDGAMAPFDHDLVLTRHVPAAAFGLKDEDLHRLPELLSGRKIIDRAYTPTALHQEDQAGGITMHIAAPAGTKGLVAGNNEVWLDRDLELAVGGVYANGRGGYTVELTALPQNGTAPAKKATKTIAKKATPAKAPTSQRASAGVTPDETLARLHAAGSRAEAHAILQGHSKNDLRAVLDRVAERSDRGLRLYGSGDTKEKLRDLLVEHEVGRRVDADVISGRSSASARDVAKTATTAAKKATPAKKTARLAKKTAAKKATLSAPEPGFPSRNAARLDDLMDASRRGESVSNAQFAAAINGNYGGLSVTVQHVDHLPTGAIAVSGSIHTPGTNPDDDSVGDFERLFYRDGDGKLVASHEFLQLDPEVQGSGFAREFNANLFDWYRRSGFDRVEVHADIDVGGYTWSTQGFDFQDADALSKWLYRARKRLDSVFGRGASYSGPPLAQVFPNLTEDEIDRELQSLDTFLTQIDGGRPTSAYEISQLGRKRGMGRNDMWVGKWIMLGSDWQGALRL